MRAVKKKKIIRIKQINVKQFSETDHKQKLYKS